MRHIDLTFVGESVTTLHVTLPDEMLLGEVTAVPSSLLSEGAILNIAPDLKTIEYIATRVADEIRRYAGHELLCSIFHREQAAHGSKTS